MSDATPTLSDKLRAKTVANIFAKVKAGKIPTAREQKILDEWESEQGNGKPPKERGRPELPGLPREFPTMKAMTGATGIPIAVLKHSKKDGCPAFHKSNRIRFDVWVKWWFSPDNQRAPDPGDWTEELVKARTERERFRLERDKGQYYDADEFDERIRGAVAKMQSELQRRLLAVVPGEAANMSARDVQRVMRVHLEKWADYAQAEADKIRKEVTG